MITRENFQARLNAVAIRIAAFRKVRAEERDVTALKRLNAVFLGLLMEEVEGAGEISWSNYARMGELRTEVSRLINETLDARR